IVEQYDVTSETALSAFVAGYEVCARIAVALGGVQDKLHDAGTWGTIGAAVGATYIVTRADARKIGEAIEGAAAVCLFPYRATPMQGATIHHLYIGLAAVIGIAVAQGVAAGLTSVEGTLEDFFGPRAGHRFRPELLTADIAADGTWSAFQLRNAHFK